MNDKTKRQFRLQLIVSQHHRKNVVKVSVTVATVIEQVLFARHPVTYCYNISMLVRTVLIRDATVLRHTFREYSFSRKHSRNCLAISRVIKYFRV